MSEAINYQWWSDDSPRHERVTAVFNRIASSTLWRREVMLRHERLYHNAPILGLGRSGTRTGQVDVFNTTKLAFNVVKSCCDAFISELCEDRPRVTVLTSGADWSLQQRAKMLEKFIDGQFYQAGVYDTLQRMALDSAIVGLGVGKVMTSGEGKKRRVAVERVLPWEMLIDEQESMYGAPRSMGQRKWIDRQVLISCYPEKELELRQTVSSSIEAHQYTYDTVSDLLEVIECWHLPSSDKSKDGRHSIVVNNATLVDEPWSRDSFPFVFLLRQPVPIGFWGIGLAEELTGIQLEMNVLLQKIQLSHKKLAAGHWLVAGNTTVKVDAEVASIMRYTGTKPEAYVPMAVSPEIYSHLDRLYQRAYEITGISQLSAQGQKPAGLNSGLALTTYSDLKSKRFTVSFHLYQQLVLELARLVIEEAREIAESNPDYAVSSFDRMSSNRIRFLDADMEEHDAILQMFPTNSLAKEPAARQSQVQDLINSQMISPEDGRRLLNYPDLDEFERYEQASFNCVMRSIDRMLRDGEYDGPEPFMNLEDALKRVQFAYLDARQRGVEEDRLQLLRDYMEAVTSLLEAAAPPEPPPGNGMPGAPPGMPPDGPMPPPGAGPPMPPGMQ